MSDERETTLRSRAGDKCELCGATDGLHAHDVAASTADDVTGCVLACATCADQINEQVELDAKHWFCLKEAMWSEVAAVQVTSYRLLHRLGGEAWAQDLLGQMYLEDSVLEWAKAGLAGESEAGQAPTLDSNGTALADGDSVTLIKSLDVKGTNFVAKRGTLVKNIRLIPDDPNNVEGRVNKVSLVLKTCFIKKSS